MPSVVTDVTPFTEFVVKLNSACNLACSYCYMYESVDPVAPDRARDRANVMSRSTATQVGYRIAEHLTAHGRTRIRIVLHGGEPLLCGVDTVVDIVSELRDRVGDRAHLDFSLQTNGVLLTAAVVDALRAAGVRVGISLDGDRAANDRYRRFRDGRSSYPQVVRALALLRDSPDVFAGILAVVDLANDPVATYESLLAYAPPAMDFLLPHGNWTQPPPNRPADDTAPYGDWLVSVFDRWYDAPLRETRIRLFEEIIEGLLGGASRTESIGLSPAGVVVIDVDGSLEQVDALRTAYPGARSTGLNVFEHSFDAALTNVGIRARQGGVDTLPEACRSCPVHRVCGGGYYPHRYSAERGFQNPSVYSPDLRRLIEHVDRRVRMDVSRILSQVAR
jgi:uncharacterized protein